MDCGAVMRIAPAMDVCSINADSSILHFFSPEPARETRLLQKFIWIVRERGMNFYAMSWQNRLCAKKGATVEKYANAILAKAPAGSPHIIQPRHLAATCRNRVRKSNWQERKQVPDVVPVLSGRKGHTALIM